jgi:hypothetical protein
MVTSVWTSTSTVRVEDAVLLGADQLLAVQQQERPVSPVRHLEGRCRPLAGAAAGFLQRKPVVVVETGGEELGDLRAFAQLGHGADPTMATQ